MSLTQSFYRVRESNRVTADCKGLSNTPGILD